MYNEDFWKGWLQYAETVDPGGFNDLFKNVEMGAMTDINNKSGKYNEYTTAGALESICYFLDKNYKDSIKLFVLCHNCSTRIKQSQYWSLMKNILDKWFTANRTTGHLSNCKITK